MADQDITKLIDPSLLAATRNSTTSSSAAAAASSSQPRDPNRARASLANYKKFRATLKSPAYFGNSPSFVEETIILDIGGRYSKVGFVGEPSPRRIINTCLYLGDYRKSAPYSFQKFKSGVKLLPVVLSLSRVMQSPSTWDEITEILVNDLLFNQLEIKPDKRRVIVLQDTWWPKAFQNGIAKAIYRHKCPGIQFVDSLHTSLFCTGSNTGIVLDIGYHTSKLQCTLYGHIIPESTAWTAVGFHSVMSHFKKLMKEETKGKIDFDTVFRVDDEQIEAAVARTCFVSPLEDSKDDNNNNNNNNNNNDNKDNKDKSANVDNDQDGDQANNNSNNKSNLDDNGPPRKDLKVKSISYEFHVKKQSAFCKITSFTRQYSCDILFNHNRFFEETNLVHFVCDMLLKIPIDARGKVVSHLLLTGGTCCLPGFESRFLQEWNYALDNIPKYIPLKALKHRLKLITNKLPHNIRSFVGASIYGGITSPYFKELFIEKEQFENEVNSNIYDWSDDVFKESQIQYKKVLTHADIVKMPAYRGRANINTSAASNVGAVRPSAIGIGGVSSNAPKNSLNSPRSTIAVSTGVASSRLGDISAFRSRLTALSRGQNEDKDKDKDKDVDDKDKDKDKDKDNTNSASKFLSSKFTLNRKKDDAPDNEGDASNNDPSSSSSSSYGRFTVAPSRAPLTSSLFSSLPSTTTTLSSSTSSDGLPTISINLHGDKDKDKDKDKESILNQYRKKYSDQKKPE